MIGFEQNTIELVEPVYIGVGILASYSTWVSIDCLIVTVEAKGCDNQAAIEVVVRYVATRHVVVVAKFQVG